MLRARLNAVLIAVLAFVWVPLTFHCQLEALPGFEFLRCSTDLPASNDGGDPCEEGRCCAIESAKYQSPRPQEITPVVLVAILPSEHFDLVAQSLPAEVTLGILTAAPPEWPASWQFALRAALPVRAPSPAS